MRNAECGIGTGYAARRTPHSAREKGQASLEMTVALIGALILLFGTLKVFLWVNTRLIQRQQSYEATRAQAGIAKTYTAWQEPATKLDLFR